MTWFAQGHKTEWHLVQVMTLTECTRFRDLKSAMKILKEIDSPEENRTAIERPTLPVFDLHLRRICSCEVLEAPSGAESETWANFQHHVLL